VDLRVNDGTGTRRDTHQMRERELNAARARLVLHRLDPQAGRCSACAQDAPCEDSQQAAWILAEAGAWNTVPFTSSLASAWEAARRAADPVGGWRG
jgi:hypothetical protein